MNSFLRQATASQSRAIGPFVDDVDFKTAETGLTIANTDIKLSVNGGASADKNSGGGTHRVNGIYGVTFDATDTATVGELLVSVKVSGALPVFHTFVVLEEAVFDALFAASALGYVANAPVNVAQFGGSNGTFASGRPEVNTTHAAGTAWGSGAITAASIASDAITAAKIADGAIDAGALASDTITAAKIAADAITAAKIATGAITSAKFAAGAIDAAAIADNAIDAGALAADAITAAKLAADVTTELQNGLATAAALSTVEGKIDTIDDFLDTEMAATLAAVLDLVAASVIRENTAQAGSGTTITLDASASAVDDFYNNCLIVIASGTGAGQARFISDYVGSTKVATVPTWATNPSSDSVFYILPFGAIPGATAPTAAEVADAVWEEAIADHSGTSGSTAEQLAAAGAAGDPWATALPGAYGSGTAGKIVGDNLNATVSSRASQSSVDTIDDFLDTEVAAILAAVDTEVAAILADTNELQTDWANGGRLDLLIDAILADTAELQGDWADGGRLDLILDAILVDTGTTLQGELDGIQADTEDIQTRLPAALVGGRIDATVDGTGLEAGALALINAEVDQAITDAALATAAALSAIDGKIDTIDNFLDTEIAAILEDTGTTLDDLVDDLEGRLTAALAAKLTAHAAAVLTMVVDAGSSTTAVVFKTVEGATASAVDDFYNGRVIIFTSGALAGQATSISDYVGATKTATVPALTGSPAEDVQAIIV